jgi:antitoxin component of MazEF toxin-antitoxin module
MRLISMAEKTVVIRKVGNSLGIFFPKGVAEVYDFNPGDVLAVDYRFPEILLRKKKVD